MLAILSSLNAHSFPIFQSILMIIVSKFMVHRAFSDKTYLSLGLLSPLSSRVVHFLYFDDFHSSPHSLTPSQSFQKSPKWDTESSAEICTLFPEPTPPSPHCICCIPAKPKTYYARKKFKFIIFTICFLVNE